MSKTSLDKKAARQFVIDSREKGLTDQEIYSELSQRYYDKKSIAFLITSIVTPANRERYRVLNYVLAAFLALVVLSRSLLVVDMALHRGAWFLLLLGIVPLFAAIFAIGITRYNAVVYRVCGYMAVFGLLRSLPDIGSNVWFAVELFITAVIAGLSLYLGAKLFPGYSYKLRRDTNGEFILDPAV